MEKLSFKDEYVETLISEIPTILEVRDILNKKFDEKGVENNNIDFIISGIEGHNYRDKLKPELWLNIKHNKNSTFDIKLTENIKHLSHQANEIEEHSKTIQKHKLVYANVKTFSDVEDLLYFDTNLPDFVEEKLVFNKNLDNLENTGNFSESYKLDNDIYDIKISKQESGDYTIIIDITIEGGRLENFI